MKKMILAGLMLLTASSAMAAPLCLTKYGMAPLCIYSSPRQCQAEAARQNGGCEANPLEVKVPSDSYGGYVLMTQSGGFVHGYADGNECAQAALKQNAACLRAANQPATPIPNDFQPNANR